jgi:hypothetical protein
VCKHFCSSVSWRHFCLPWWNQLPWQSARNEEHLSQACLYISDYLSISSLYPPAKLRKTFRNHLKLYWIIHGELVSCDPSLYQQIDGFGRPGHTSHQKILMSMRLLGSGASFMQLDDSARMSVESMRSAFYRFLNAMINRFEPKYLNRGPTLAEIRSMSKDTMKTDLPAV